MKSVRNILLTLLIASLIIVMTPAAAVRADEQPVWDLDKNFEWGYALVEEGGVFHAEVRGSAVHFPAGVTPSGRIELDIPEEIDGYQVTGVATNAFYNSAPFICEGTEIYLTIPGHIKKIGNNAFNSVPNLKCVTIESGVQTIGQGVFANSGVVSVSLPQGLRTISADTFKYCRQLKEVNIPDTVESIGSYAFYFCTDLKDIYIPETVTFIGEKAFGCWSGLIIHAKAGSYAAKFAEREGIPLVEEGSVDPEDMEKTITVNQDIEGKNSLNAFVGDVCYVPVKRKAGYLYESVDNDIATVSKSGRIMLKDVGQTRIRITAPAWTSTAAEGDITVVRQYKKAVKMITVISGLDRPTLCVKSLKGRKATISWSKVEGATGYKLYIKFPGRSGFKCVLTKPGKVKGVTHRGLIAGKKYKYKIRAFKNKNGKIWYSDFSKAKTVTVRK